MKKIIGLILVSLALVGCASKEDKLGLAAIKELEEKYNLDSVVEVISVEEQPVRIAYVVYALDKLINGEQYDVVLQVNEEIPFQVEGGVNARSKGSVVNYIKSKDLIFREENVEYQEILEQLEDMGVHEVDLSDRDFNETTRSIYFSLELEHAELSVDKLIVKLEAISNMLIENMDTSKEVIIKIDGKSESDLYSNDVVKIDLGEFGDGEYETFIETFDIQLAPVKIANSIDDEFIEAIGDFNLDLVLSKIDSIPKYKLEEKDGVLHKHKLELHLLEGIKEDDLFEGILFLQEKNFSNSLLKLHTDSGSTLFCEVAKIKKIKDVKICFPSVHFHEGELQD